MIGKRQGGTSTRSGLLDVIVAAVLPGLPTMRRHRLQGAGLLVLGVVGPIVWLVVTVMRHGSWVQLGLDRAFLGQLIVVIAIATIARLAGVGEVLAAWSGRGRAGLRSITAFATLVAVTVPSAVGAAAAAVARADIDRAFGSESEAPIFDAAVTTPTEPPTTTTTTTQAPVASTAPPTTVNPLHRIPNELVPEPDPRKPLRPDSGVDPEQLDSISTILLLGGDAGPGRSGLRTDSMILVSVHRPSGRVALISVPRNLERILFPPGSALEARYPYGFDDISNAVYPRVSNNEELRDAYRIEGLRPGAVATVQTLGYSLDVTIDDYVLVDMQGFLEVVDAVGGVTVDVPKAVPAPGNVPGAKHALPDYISAGTQHMDGTTALAYVRSRKADSDYQRMRRQRDVLGALATQVSLGDALTGYTAVTSALGDSLHTSLSTDEFANFIDLLGAQTSIVESVGLNPPLVNVVNPDYDEMAKIVGRIQLALISGKHSGY